MFAFMLNHGDPVRLTLREITSNSRIYLIAASSTDAANMWHMQTMSCDSFPTF